MKIAVGLSGGVDSGVAALLLRRAGHDVVGITMKLWRGTFRGGARDACFGPGEAEDIERARALAESLGIEYRVLDCSEAYEREIVGLFRETTLRGETPNPCVMCNAAMKFGLLPRLARESGLDFDRFATGHYARIAETGGRLAVRCAADGKKDQSYFLYRLSQEQLSLAMFPLGGLEKTEVRRIAAESSLAVADQADSQDFYSGDRDELIGAPPREGDIVGLDGRVLGRHRGFWNFTVGQRKGLGAFGPKPLYVVRLDACRNRVVLGTREEAFSREFRVGDMNWMAQAPTTSPLEAFVKVRSTGAPLGPVTLADGVCRASGEGIFGVAPGQSAVFYDAGGVILCGGVILPSAAEI
ncbi:MAG: tRNA 2-thiouridine(34) synthase MnmA [Kiritimatiellae bacterium]|nr:tRNA 2-thiouridine(34) synthase MnmA [Kiritimatiellia bacterium]